MTSVLPRGRYALAMLGCALLASTAMAQTAPPLDAYGELPQIDDVQLSISGDSLAVVLAKDGGRQVVVLDRNMAPKRSLKIDDTKVRDVDWIGEEALMFTYSSTEKMPLGFRGGQQEFYRALIAPLDAGKEAKLVFGDNRDMVRNVFGSYGIRKVDGKWTGYFGGIPLVMKAITGYTFEHGRPYLYAVDLQKNKPKQVAFPATVNIWRDWLVGADGRVAATFDVNRKVGDWKLLNADDKVIASGKQANGKAGLVTLGTDGTSIVYYQEDPATKENVWYEIPGAGGSAKEILADVTIDGFYTERGTGRMLGYFDKPTQRPVFFDPAKQATVQKIFGGFFGKNVTLRNWSNDFQHFVIKIDGNRDPGTWYLIAPETGQVTKIGSERPAISPEQVGPISTIKYKAQDGLEIDGILTLPPGIEAKNLPVIMLPHGGPSNHDEADFDWWAQALASRGYAVFQPNFRGSTNKDTAFERAGHGEWGKKMQTDISDGLAELARRGIVDSKRACIAGASYGGYAALAGVTLQKGLYRCAVAVAPVSDLGLMYKNDYLANGSSQLVKDNVLEELGPESGFDAASPRKFADRADAPILLIHGRDDTVVPYRQSTVMADALKDAGKPYELVDLGSEDHWLSRSESRKQMLRDSVAFIEKYNPAN